DRVPLLCEQEQMRRGVGAPAYGVIAFLHEEHARKIRRQAADLVVTRGVDVLCLREIRDALSGERAQLFGIVKPARKNADKGLQSIHGKDLLQGQSSRTGSVRLRV